MKKLRYYVRLLTGRCTDCGHKALSMTVIWRWPPANWWYLPYCLWCAKKRHMLGELAVKL